MNTSSEHLTKQKLAIAKLLPERIVYIGDMFYWRSGINDGKTRRLEEILDTEWLQIVQDARKVKGIKSKLTADAALEEQMKELCDE